MIPVNEPVLSGNELKYLEECISTGWISSEGPFVEKFEAGMAARVKRKHAIAVCNGTAALELAIAALQLESGDQVVLPTFTIISCVLAVIRNGCTPVFIDSDPVTWNMDLDKLEELLVQEIERKGNRRIKAIMAVHIYGLPVDMRRLMEIADRFKLKVVEDAAEMHGQTCRGEPCGSFGDISVFSFYPNKHVTTGEGGMVLVDDDKLAERCRSLRNLCFQAGRRFVHEELGYNFRMTNLQAAVGVAQLERLDEFVVKKRHMGRRYTELLAKTPGVDLPLAATDYAENIYWVFGLVLKDEVPWDAEEMAVRLRQHGIATRPFFWPMHEQPVLHKLGMAGNSNHPVAERLARRGFYVPSGMALTPEQIEIVAASINSELIRNEYR